MIAEAHADRAEESLGAALRRIEVLNGITEELGQQLADANARLLLQREPSAGLNRAARRRAQRKGR